ncbi:MAG: MATE family efflux transporter [Deltaproteobacteria bacterium]|jgi:MATE family multidrug resistance protein|nr:MATE family efflux transporter [Deltaproteobacteria bacterium]
MSFSYLKDALRAQLSDISLAKRWNSPQGYKDFLKICLPLIASTMASSIMLFTDRLFLSRYSMEAIAASLPAGVIKLTITAVFLGVASYTGVFAAQYTGANLPKRAAAALWQGLYFSFFIGLLLSLLYFASPWLFRLVGHDPAIAAIEVQYFSVLTLGSIPELLMVSMSCFLASMGRTRSVMWVSVGGALLNVPLDYVLIFGLKIGEGTLIPAMGAQGAALATVFSWVASAGAFALLIFNKKMEKSHGVCTHRSLEPALFFRLMKFGWPGGLQFFMEIFAFAFFAAAVGWLDSLTLATNNIVLSIEGMSFIPMLGAGQAVSILVGQAIGRGRPDEGAQSTKSGMVLSTIYVVTMAGLFIFIPVPLLSIFLDVNVQQATQTFILSLGPILLRFVAVYCLFDGFYLCCFGAIRGAGDVWFPMLAMGFWGIFGLMIPMLALLALKMASIYAFWLVLVFYVLGLTATGIWRYQSRVWMTKSVINPQEIAPRA